MLETLSSALNETITDLKKIESQENDMDIEQIFNPEIKMFFDNILISLKCKQSNIDNYITYLRLLSLIGNIQLKFLINHGLFLRDGVSKGKFYSDDKIVFGEALIKAYELEEKANYHKILLESNELKDILAFINNDDTKKNSIDN